MTTILPETRSGVTIGLTTGLPSVAVLDMPDRVSLSVAAYLREWAQAADKSAAYALRHRITVKLTPSIRRGHVPSAQSIASYVQSAVLHGLRDGVVS